MQTTLTVDARVMGQKQPLIHELQVPLSFAQESITLRELITQIVLNQVAAFQERQAENRLTRVLSAEQIEQGQIRGKIDMGGRTDLNQQVDPQAAVATALQAFDDGLYLVFVDETQQHSLDAPITLQSNSHITFIRLIMLAGG